MINGWKKNIIDQGKNVLQTTLKEQHIKDKKTT